MSYVPNDSCVYLAAFAGGFAGIRASGTYLTDVTQADYTFPAEQADAFAQAVDTAWASSTHAAADLQQIQSICQGVWIGRSPLKSDNGNSISAAAYTELAEGVVAAVKAGTAQISAEGIDPNGCNGGVTPITSPFQELSHTATPITSAAWKYAADTSGGPVNLILTGTPATNQLLIMAVIGSVSNPVNITAPAGTVIWNPATGAFAASASITGGPGAAAQWQYDAPNSRFIEIV